MNGERAPGSADDESLVDLRCSVVVVRGAEILLVNRGGDNGDWVLPGGRPRPGESMQSCARREALEETGVRVSPSRCAFVGEVIDPDDSTRIVELVFAADLMGPEHVSLSGGEAGATPRWVPLDQLRGLHLRPPIGGYLAGFARDDRRTAAYLGNLWRPANSSEDRL